VADACTDCGKKIKIIAFVTHTAQIQRILSGIGWPCVAIEFDPPYELWNCQLVPGTKKMGFLKFRSKFIMMQEQIRRIGKIIAILLTLRIEIIKECIVLALP
jgi:hypothetical protein